MTTLPNASYMRWRPHPGAMPIEVVIYRCSTHRHPWMGDTLGCEATRYANVRSECSCQEPVYQWGERIA